MTALNWVRTGSAGQPAPCVICQRPAICRAPSGKPCHKTCAETWMVNDEAEQAAVQPAEGLNLGRVA